MEKTFQPEKAVLRWSGSFQIRELTSKKQQQNQRCIWQLGGHTFGGLALVPADI